ncbi:MAG: hypothetical protein LBE13_02310 [Bacteroidales bacterium]|jgi:sugar O-acyltransferase (sialic acid O-acetyltransferase NeuD family)|nr:hypothetical protein [Bacteroidales bacterium]
MNKKVIVFGNNLIAEVLYHDSKQRGIDFDIEAFCVDESYLQQNVFCGKPLIGFQEAIKKYPPKDYDMISTVEATSRLRNRLVVFTRLKEAGYFLRNYISPLAEISGDIELGENNLILSFVFIDPQGKMGNANLIRPHAFLGYDFHIGDGNTIAPACAVAGHGHIGNSCFLGINATVLPHIHIADETLIGAGSVVTNDTNPYTVYAGNPARAISTHEKDGIMLKVTVRDE